MTPMPSFRLSITPHKAAGAQFIARVRRELQKALAEERTSRNLKQTDIARLLGVNRPVINRQFLGVENLTLGRVGELAYALDRELEFALRRPEVIEGTNHPAATVRAAPKIITSTTGHTANAPLLPSSPQITTKVA